MRPHARTPGLRRRARPLEPRHTPAEAAGGARPLEPLELVERLASTRIGATFNQYSESELLRERLRAYLERGAGAPFLLVGEAPGYRGARISGVPFTSERQLTGAGPSESTATIVHRALDDLDLEASVLLWNAVPTHPGTASSNRRPTRAEVEASSAFLAALARGRRVLAVGRLAAAATGAPYIRHPSHGGAAAFREGLAAATIRRRRTPVRRVCA